MTKMIAWAALCLASSAMTVLWWPLGLIPCVWVLALGAQYLALRMNGQEHQQRHHRRA